MRSEGCSSGSKRPDLAWTLPSGATMTLPASGGLIVWLGLFWLAQPGLFTPPAAVGTLHTGVFLAKENH